MKVSSFNQLYKVLLLFKPQIDKWVIKSLFGTGLTLIVSGLSGVSWYIAIALKIVKVELREQLGKDYGFGVIEWNSIIIGFVLLSIGLIIYSLNKRLELRIIQKPRLLIAIIHKSIDEFLKPDCRSIRNGYYRGYDIQEIIIDQTLTYEGGSLNHQGLATMLQKDITVTIKTLVETNSNTEIAYFGLAHIPLLFLIGFQLADKYNIDFFEYNRKTFIWDYINGESKSIEINKHLEILQTDSSNGIILIEVSYNIDNNLVLEVVPDYSVICRISIDEIALDSISTRVDVSELANTFRTCLDEIIAKKPIIETLHLFYAGPVSLAVNIARKISKRTDPKFIIYNYQRSASPKYKWGIDISVPISSNDSIIIN